MGKPLLFVVALPWEKRAIARQLKTSSAGRSGAAELERGVDQHRNIWFLRTGMGPERADRAIRWAAEIVQPHAVISTGCAGSLAAGLAAGDVIAPHDVVDADGRKWPTSPRWRERYERAAAAAGIRAWSGRIATTARVLSGCEEKRRFAERTTAIAVEMEGAAIAAWASAAKIDFAAVRVIVDSLEMAIPMEVLVLSTQAGRVSPLRLLRAIFGRPAIVRELWSLGTAAAKCRRALSAIHRQVWRDLLRDGAS